MEIKIYQSKEHKINSKDFDYYVEQFMNDSGETYRREIHYLHTGGFIVKDWNLHIKHTDYQLEKKYERI